MDEIWERAVETALDGQTDVDLVRTLTFDGAVKCVHGRLPPPSLFEKFHNLQHISMANIGVSSLENFPRLRNLQKLILSDNRIAGGLEFLVEAGLESLRDLDLSNNRISDINDLRSLAEVRLISLDLYECPVTRIKDYRSRVFSLISSLKYLDKMDSEENERPESDDEEEGEDDDEDDPGSGEVDGGGHQYKPSNGQRVVNDAVVDEDEDEDEESDADEEEAQTSRGVNGLSHVGNLHQYCNGFNVEAVNGEEDEEGDEEDDSVEEVYEDDDGEDEDVVEVSGIDGSDGEDGVDDDDDDEEEEEEDEDDNEEVDNEEMDYEGPESTSRLTSTEGEIDGHEQGEDAADEDDDGETGEEEQAVEKDGDFEDEEEAEDEEDDHGSGYLVQPVTGRVEVDADADAVGEGEDPEIDDEDVEDCGEVQELRHSSSSHKRKRSDDDDDDGGDADEEDEDEDEDDHVVQYTKSSKHW
ncbi:hypothetical protein OROGR_023764 [Orobanche gracilis]